MKQKFERHAIKRCEKCGSEDIRYNYFKRYSECMNCKARINKTLNDY